MGKPRPPGLPPILGSVPGGARRPPRGRGVVAAGSRSPIQGGSKVVTVIDDRFQIHEKIGPPLDRAVVELDPGTLGVESRMGKSHYGTALGGLDRHPESGRFQLLVPGPLPAQGDPLPRNELCYGSRVGRPAVPRKRVPPTLPQVDGRMVHEPPCEEGRPGKCPECFGGRRMHKDLATDRSRGGPGHHAGKGQRPIKRPGAGRRGSRDAPCTPSGDGCKGRGVSWLSPRQKLAGHGIAHSFKSLA
jgi:hypothetical protein